MFDLELSSLEGGKGKSQYAFTLSSGMAYNRSLLPVCNIPVEAITATNYSAGIQENTLHILKLRCLGLEREHTC